jgi:hypothetical protein
VSPTVLLIQACSLCCSRFCLTLIHVTRHASLATAVEHAQTARPVGQYHRALMCRAVSRLVLALRHCTWLTTHWRVLLLTPWAGVTQFDGKPMAFGGRLGWRLGHGFFFFDAGSLLSALGLLVSAPFAVPHSANVDRARVWEGGQYRPCALMRQAVCSARVIVVNR